MIFAYTYFGDSSGEIANTIMGDKVDVKSVSLTDYNNDFWDEEDKILYVTIVPKDDIRSDGELGFSEVIDTTEDGRSIKITSIIGDWCRENPLLKGESYTSGIAFESDNETIVHVEGKIVVFEHINETAAPVKKIIGHFDSDV